MSNEIIIAFMGAVVTLLGSYMLFKKDIRLKEMDLQLKESKAKNTETVIKVNVLDNLLKMSVYSQISDAVSLLFLETKVERFMIFIAVNGITDFKVVSIIFERYKDLTNKTNALARYHNVHIDQPYKQMLKDAEKFGSVEVDSESMPPQLLKDVYENERVKHSIVSFILRRNIDADNDLIVFSSAATTIPIPFDNLEKLSIKTCIEGSLQPNL
jgi:hypothetical protein